MEQKAKKYEKLNRYERAMTNASLEQRLEAMARDIEQIAKVLKLAVHVDADYYNWKDDARTTVYMIGDGEGHVTKRVLENDDDFFGIIDEANRMKAAKEEEDND